MIYDTTAHDMNVCEIYAECSSKYLSYARKCSNYIVVVRIPLLDCTWWLDLGTWFIRCYDIVESVFLSSNSAAIAATYLLRGANPEERQSDKVMMIIRHNDKALFTAANP